MRSRLTTLLLVISAISLGGCALGKAPIKATPIGAGCSAFFIFKPSRKDTLGSKQQMLAHNTTYRALCPGVTD